MKKAIFFDIDGTLWDYSNRIPDSAKEAIRLLQKNGHLTFLCSGRSRAFIKNPELLALGFDGIISGCGTMIEYRDQILLYKRIEPELAAETIRTLWKYRFFPVLEGREFMYMDADGLSGDSFGKKIRQDMGDHLLPIQDNWGKWEFSKFSCLVNPETKDACLKELSEAYDYMFHNEKTAEFVPKGYHKGTGIQKVCELLGLSIADTYAFGDSINDLGMFRCAGTAIAMGNGTEPAKAAAAYVTTALNDDGIWNACRHYSLI